MGAVRALRTRPIAQSGPPRVASAQGSEPERPLTAGPEGSRPSKKAPRSGAFPGRRTRLELATLSLGKALFAAVSADRGPKHDDRSDRVRSLSVSWGHDSGHACRPAPQRSRPQPESSHRPSLSAHPCAGLHPVRLVRTDVLTTSAGHGLLRRTRHRPATHGPARLCSRRWARDPEDEGHLSVRALGRAAVEQGEASFPLSMAYYVETQNRCDWRSRFDDALTMGQFPGGLGFLR